MSVNIIKYNGIEIGSPTPFVTLERSHVFNGQKLGNVDKIKLIGQLTGKYSDLTGYQQGLINNFNQDFKTFEILEGISGINLQSECDANIFLSKINDFYYQSNEKIDKEICLKINQNIKITGNDAGANNNFGFSVSLNSIGNVALIGAHQEDPNGVSNAGSAYIFTGSGNSWVQTAKITGNDAQISDNFGWNVSLNSAGNIALIGALNEDPNGIVNAGSAYIFTGSGNSWIQVAKITGNDAQAGDSFGNSVHLNSAGNIALIGAILEDPNGLGNAGSAYIFTGSGNSWIQTAKITGNDAQAGDFFGISVALNSAGNVALVGAYGEDPNGVTSAGSAYIFTGSGNSWVQTAKITGNDAQISDNFGTSVSINSLGNVALIGAYNADPNGINAAGSAYIFTGSGNSWVQTAKITGNDAAANDFFATRVSLNSLGNVALVGAINKDPNGVTNAGCVYLFTGSGNSWVQTAKITGNDAGAFDLFGYSVSLNSAGNVALIGAYTEDPNGLSDAGSAYIFDISRNCGNIYIKNSGNNWYYGATELGQYSCAFGLGSQSIYPWKASWSQCFGGLNCNPVNIQPVYENILYKKSGVLVNSINFSEGVYNGILNYEIDLTAKDFNYNIQNPVNQFVINKQNNTITLNHNVSAQGINTSSTNYSNSLDNAISFVNQFTGLNGVPNLYIEKNIGSPESITVSDTDNYDGIYNKASFGERTLWINESNSNYIIEAPSNFSELYWTFYDDGNETISENPSANPNEIPTSNWVPSFNIQINNNSNYILLEQKESINRIDSIYSVQETYTKDLADGSTQNGILRYTIDYNSGAEQETVSFTVKGSYSDSAINKNFANLKSNFNSIENGMYSRVVADVQSFYTDYISPIVLSKSINENSGANTIDFSYEYDNLNLPNPYFNYLTNVSRDEISQIVSINVNVDIIARGGTLSNRYNLVNQNANLAEYGMSGVAENAYINFLGFNSGFSGINYRIRKIRSNRIESPTQGKISISANFDDKEVPTGIWKTGVSGISEQIWSGVYSAEIDYSVSKELPIWYFSTSPTLLRNNYIFQDFDIHTPLRSNFNVNAKVSKSVPSEKMIYIGSEIMPTGIQSGVKEEVKNIKYDLESRTRNMKISTEIISTQPDAEFPKTI